MFYHFSQFCEIEMPLLSLFKDTQSISEGVGLRHEDRRRPRGEAGARAPAAAVAARRRRCGGHRALRGLVSGVGRSWRMSLGPLIRGPIYAERHKTYRMQKTQAYM